MDDFENPKVRRMRSQTFKEVTENPNEVSGKVVERLLPGVSLILGRNSFQVEYALNYEVRSSKISCDSRKVCGSAVFAYNREAKFGYANMVGNSMHHKDIEEMFKWMLSQDIRWLLSTMHPWVVDRIVLRDRQDASTRLYFAKPVGGVQTLSEKELARFWEAYNAGIQHVSEILVSQGLW